MIILRTLGVLLPQLLIFQVLGSMHDFIGGWNRAPDSSFIEILIMLFLLNPVITITWLISEPVKYFRQEQETNKNRTRCVLMTILALIFFIEAMAIDWFILTQIRM